MVRNVKYPDTTAVEVHQLRSCRARKALLADCECLPGCPKNGASWEIEHNPILAFDCLDPYRDQISHQPSYRCPSLYGWSSRTRMMMQLLLCLRLLQTYILYVPDPHNWDVFAGYVNTKPVMIIARVFGQVSKLLATLAIPHLQVPRECGVSLVYQGAKPQVACHLLTWQGTSK